ncbi:FKBP-type peptidyl-prolyl cis-trans isomerase [Prosthecobacter sp.]|uniref:FKBP-type peptidyl-prolyl cis-trans isomerase n=1 Tax=Prosthecobacter sp. TaxID=1965333 RepID=UPI003783D2ED
MKPTTALLCAAFTAASLVHAQEVKPAQPAAAADAAAPAATPAAPALPMDKISYFIGKNVGASILRQQEKVDMKEFAAGVKEALTAKKSSSFTMGSGLGQQFVSEGIPIDIDKLIAGITFTVEHSSEKPAYTEEELTTAMASFEIFMKAKAEANMTPEQRAEAAAVKKKIAENKEAGVKFLAENAKRKGVTTTKSGLQYEIIKEGTGPKPAITDVVKVHYHGTLVDGKVFDSSVERGEPATFPLQGVIRGWTEALQLMPVGSKWRIFVPADLAYGDEGRGEDIGPGVPLIFDVELLGIVKQ